MATLQEVKLSLLLSLSWACHLELACLSDPKSYAGGDLVPGGFNINRVGGWALD